MTRRVASRTLQRAATWLLLTPCAAFGQHDEHAHHPPQTEAVETEHVPPDPPSTPYVAGSHRDMAAAMQMDDRHRFGQFVVERLELSRQDGSAVADLDAWGWYGGDIDRLWVQAEGTRQAGRTEDARVEGLWDHVIGRWWSAQAGLRRDLGEGPDATWLALGVKGLAPYFFDVSATAYVADGGRAAVRVAADVDVLLTQRLVLQPQFEVQAYGRRDVARDQAAGLARVDAGIRLRYEIRREFAPYVGVAWSRTDSVANGVARDFAVVAGLRFWL